MNGLFAGELQRVLSRRLVRVLAILAVVGVAVAGVLVFLNTQKADPGVVAAGRRAAQARFAQCQRSQVARAPVAPDAKARPGGPDGSAVPCRSTYHDPRFRLSRLRGILQGTSAPLIVVGFLIGASVIGADWQSRTVTTLLTWEPRRARVLLTKALACVVVAAAFALAVDLLTAGALLPSAWLHGTTAGTGGAWLRSVGGVVLRGMAVVSIATVIGFAVASIGRNTAAALGIGFAYFLVVENVVGSLVADVRRWLLLGNAIVLISGKDGGGEVAGRSVVAAALFLTAVAVVLLAGATVVFARRDVA
jgi:hypothetical protein